MNRSIGIIELTSIARGIEMTDIMVKAANISILKASTICPGKYLTIISGRVEDVASAMKAGCGFGAEYVTDTMELANAHEQLIPAISAANLIEHPEAIGVMEFYSVPAGVLAADIAAKAANIELIEIKIGYAIGGKSLVVLTGDVAAVQTAISAGAAENQLLLNKAVIPNPDPALLTTLL